MPATRFATRVLPVVPGTLLSIAVTVAAVGLEAVESRIFGRAWLESLVLAILIGTAVRSIFRPDDRFSQGIRFSAKTLLEIAVVLLGASVSARAVMAAGPALLFGIVGVVVVAISFSYGIGRLLGLEHKLATLVACGNSICGNSAIVAAAPVIGATAGDIAASIAFTAVLGVVVVLVLPLLVPVLHLSETQYGVLAGLTVYAVPQVIAATAPVATLSVHVGTLVKLVRVLMLGPVVIALSLGAAGRGRAPAEPHPDGAALRRRLPGADDAALGERDSGRGARPGIDRRDLAHHRLDGRARPRRRRAHGRQCRRAGDRRGRALAAGAGHDQRSADPRAAPRLREGEGAIPPPASAAPCSGCP